VEFYVGTLIGQTLSHYLVERRLGAGGMGEVFLGRDLALGRPAAIKVIAQPLSGELRARLVREAEACARLQHPAIATFYEAGDADGVAFLAMEYVPGETLRDRLRRGPLTAPQTLVVAGCLLEALAHAHAAGVLHRDIKPENVMLTGDQLAKLLDFGIARLVGAEEVESESATATALTEAGAVIGTIGYMSPEQLKGEEIDERSDVFSLAAVLHEALTGEPVFGGNTATERIAAILSPDPPALPAGVAPEIAAVLARALAKTAALRPPTASAFLADLRAAASGEFVAALPDTLAVVDFDNLSRNADDDWIGSGIAESLAADLARADGLTIVPRGRVLAAKARSGDPLQVGRLLACRWILSGGYQRVGPRLRVTSRLADVSTGETVAAEKIDGVLDDIFSIQDRLAASALERLRPEGRTSRPPATPKIDAFERHARGRRFFLRLAKGSFEEARRAYEEAIGADPAYAPALAGLAAVHAMRFTFLTDPAELEAASSYARRAIASDPESGEPRVWLGYALMRQGRVEEAVEQQKRAAELDPANPFSWYFSACALGFAGRHAEALPFYQRAVAADARHGWSWMGLGWSHVELGAPAEGLWCLEKAVTLEQLGGPHPTVGASGYLGECLRRTGDLENARRRCLDGLDAVERSDSMYRDSFRAICLCALGRTALAQSDAPAARAAFGQAIAHLHGRPRGLGGGHLMVQALAGLARAGEGGGRLDEAETLFASRRGHDFSALWTCTDEVSLLELARAASAAGRSDRAKELFQRARSAGSGEARAIDGPGS
jgi:TolB-like protein/Tfp pilus assembly protein PilF